MGKFHTELTLILTQGSFDMYSVRRIAKEISNDCGDFILHPAPFLRKSENVVEVFEYDDLGRPAIQFLNHPLIGGI